MCNKGLRMKIAFTFPLLFTPPIASAGYIDYELLDRGTTQVRGSLVSLAGEGTLETTIGNTAYSADVDLEQRSFALDAIFAPVDEANLAIRVGAAETSSLKYSYSVNELTVTEEREGAGDLDAELRFKLGSGQSYPVVAIGATVPAGNDDEPQPEVKTASGVQQQGETGGRSRGTTDYSLGAGYFTASEAVKAFVGASYSVRGENEGTDYGDEVALLGQASVSVSESIGIVGTALYETTDNTDHNAGHNEFEPGVGLSVGGIFSISPKSELIAEVVLLDGPSISYYDETGYHYATLEMGRTAGFALTYQARF